ncbi:MAG: hypothetical protein U0105_15670 [Candidatus Obscuribacterales bacterium]
MTRGEKQPDKKPDHVKDDGQSNAASSKSAAENVTNEPQAAKYEKKFSTFSGGHDRTLPKQGGGHVERSRDGHLAKSHPPSESDQALEALMNRVNAHHDGQKTGPAAVSEFVIEDKKEGKEYSSKGERHVPRASFMDGLQKLLKTATSSAHEEEIKANYSIEYMLKKAGSFLTAAQQAVTGEVDKLINPNAQTTHKDAAPQHGPHDGGSPHPTRPHDASPVPTIPHDAVPHPPVAHDATQHRDAVPVPGRSGSTPVHQDKTLLFPEEVAARTDAVTAALNERNIWHLNAEEPNVNSMLNILQTLSPVQRQQIMAEYKHRTNHDLSQDIADKLKGNQEAVAELQAVLHRNDTVADFAGALARNLGTVTDTGSRLDQHGFNIWQNANDEHDHATAEKSILHTLQKLDSKQIAELNLKFDNPHLSSATKEAIHVLLNGKDKLEGNPPTFAKQLAEIGLRHHRLDIFMEAMQLNPEARKEFSTPAGMERLQKVFTDPLELSTAQDYAQFGHLSLASRIEGNGRIFRTNKALIEDAIAHVEPAERKLFQEGHHEFTTGGIGPKEPYEQRISRYYRDIHEALNEASGFNDKAQLDAWENALLGRKTEVKVADVFKRNEENLLDHAFASVFNSHGKAAAKVEALAHMSPSEQDSYRKDVKFRTTVDNLVSQHLQPGLEQELARDVLRNIRDGKPPVNSFDRVLLDQLHGEKGLVGFANIEKAFDEDPSRFRGASGKFNSELKNVLEARMHGVSFGAGFPEESHQTLLDSFMQTGRLPIRISETLLPDNSRVMKDILGASAQDRERLLDPHPLDPKDIEVQDKLLGTGEKREFLLRMMKQRPPEKSLETMHPEDRLRAFAVGAGDSQDGLREYLSTLTPTQIRDASHAYFNKYGHRDMGKDVLDKMPPTDQIAFRNLLSNVGVTPQQELIDARHVADKSGSLADGVHERIWDRSQIAADEKLDEADRVLAKYGKSNVTEKQRQEFHEALNKYYQAEKDYINSKSGAAKALVDSSVTLATMAATLLVPEVTIGFLVTSSAGGAATSIGVHALYEGKSAKLDREGLVKYGVEGALVGPLAVVGPEHFGLTGAFRISEKVAERAALEAITQKGVSALKPDAEKIISRGLQDLTDVQAVAGGKHTKDAIDKLVKQVTVDGGVDPVLEKAILEKLQANIKQGAVSRLEAEQLLRNASGAALSNVAGESVQEAAGLVSSDDLLSSLPQSAVQGAVMYKVFGVTGALASKLFGHIEPPHVLLARDSHGELIVGKGTVIQFANGKEWVADRPYVLGPQDKVDLRPRLKEGGHQLDLSSFKGSPVAADAAPIMPEARAQSNKLQTRGEIGEPLQPGFTLAGKGRYVSADGSSSSPFAATVVDLPNDKVLQKTLDEARAYMGRYHNLTAEQQQARLTQFVESKFMQTAVPGDKVQSIADANYMQFIKANGGKRVNLGEFIERGTGSCTQQAVLLKFLGDELLPQAHFRLVTGNGADGSNTVNHMWVQSGDRIYDPRQGTHGDFYSARHDRYKAASQMPAEARFGVSPVNIELGAHVALEGESGWTVVKTVGKDGKVTIMHDGAMTINEKDLLTANPGLQLKVGESVHLRKPDGTMDSGWQIRSRDQHSGELVLFKKDAVVMRVSPEQLLRNLPELAAARLDKNAASYLEFTDHVRLLAQARRVGSVRAELGLTPQQVERLEGLAAKVTDNAAKTKNWKEYEAVVKDFNFHMQQLADGKVRNHAAFVNDLDDLVHGRREPVKIATPPEPVVSEKVAPPRSIAEKPALPASAVRTEQERVSSNHQEQPSEKIEKTKVPEAPPEPLRPPQSFSLNDLPTSIRGDDWTSVIPPEAQALLQNPSYEYKVATVTDLLRAKSSSLGDFLEKTELASKYPSADRPQNLSKWMLQLSSGHTDFLSDMSAWEHLPERRHLLEMSRLFAHTDLKISGKDIHCRENTIFIDLPAGTRVDGKPLSEPATLKLQVTNDEPPLPSNDRRDLPFLPHKLTAQKEIDLGDGYRAILYVQERVDTSRSIPKSELDRIEKQLFDLDLRVRGRVRGYGKAGERWCVTDETALISDADNALEHAVSGATLVPELAPQLRELLEERGEIGETPNGREEKALSLWLREALARPDLIPNMDAQVHRGRLWRLADEVRHLKLQVTAGDIICGGESICVNLKPKTDYNGVKLEHGGYLKLTQPQSMAHFDQHTGTHFWEAPLLSDITVIETSPANPTYMYVQQKLTIMDARRPEDVAAVNELVSRLAALKPPWVVPDYKVIQFGKDEKGRVYLVDWTAAMPESEWHHKQRTYKGSGQGVVE